jgi:hypothetical protein
MDFSLIYRKYFMIYTVMCFERHVSEVVFLGQLIWNFVGDRLVEAYIHRNVQATKTATLEAGTSFVVLP